MPPPNDILCGDVSPPKALLGGNPLPLQLAEEGGLVNLHSKDIERALIGNLPSRFVDLLEIAAYVYCADQAIPRGGDGVLDFGSAWRRTLRFHVPVRDKDFWASDEVRKALSTTLGFLSEDDYFFEFYGFPAPPVVQGYFEFTEGLKPSRPPEEVVLFSGGLDSLGGAVQELVHDRRPVLMVTHRSHPKFARVDAHMRTLLRQVANPVVPSFLTMRVNKSMELGREYSQRTRSFLFATIAATAATMLRLQRIRFYENGVTSLNLPIAAQVVGARATRTTHPRSLVGFERLLSLVAGKPFAVENPFALKTRTDIVDLIVKANCGDLIRHTRSCTHTKDITKMHSHCGSCLQCVDRRFAILAAKAEMHDPGEAYNVDLLAGARPEGEPRTLIASYTDTAVEFSKLEQIDLVSKYGEVGRALKYMHGNPTANALKVHTMLKRHGEQVTSVLHAAVQGYTPQIVAGTLPDSCLVRLIIESRAAAGNVPSGQLPAQSPKPSPLSVPHPQAKGDNYLVRKGLRAWEFRYNGGKSRVVVQQKGAAYLCALLAKPNVDMDVREVWCLGNGITPPSLPNRPAKVMARGKHLLAFDGTAGGAGGGPGNVDDIADKKTLEACLRRCKELRADREKAVDQGRDQDVRDVDEELLPLEQQLNRWQKLGGRPAQFRGSREKMRQAVTASVKRLLAELKKVDPPFHAHLVETLSGGYRPCYRPKGNVRWSCSLTP